MAAPAKEPLKETIHGVAIQYDGHVYSMQKGRHGWLIESIRGDGLPRAAANLVNQGFVTNTGRFVTRKEAVPIAKAAGQLRRPIGRAIVLTSEDLW